MYISRYRYAFRLTFCNLPATQTPICRYISRRPLFSQTPVRLTAYVM